MLTAKHIKLMTYNIQHGVSYMSPHKEIDLRLIASAVSYCNPDIVILNEVRDSGDTLSQKQTEKIARYAGFGHYYFSKAITFGNGIDYGNAIISRFPFKNVVTVKIPDPVVKDEPKYYETRSALRADFSAENDFSVFGVHIGLADSEQRNAVSVLLAETMKCACPFAVCGDFNMTPDSPTLSPLLERCTDTAELFRGADKKSWPSDEPEVKIDYILVGGGARAVHADIPTVIASDHRPHTATVSFVRAR